MNAPTQNDGISSAKLAHWYFRLNGFLTVENFVLHPESRGAQRTDADLYGVRFPGRQEHKMLDDDLFRRKASNKPLFVIVEITRGECKLNGPWTNPARENIEYVLSAIGAFNEVFREVANALYAHCRYDQDDRFDVQLVAVGSTRSDEFRKNRPDLVQMVFPDMLKFIHERFRQYRTQKANHQQWDRTGQRLWDMSERVAVEEFVKSVTDRLS